MGTNQRARARVNARRAGVLLNDERCNRCGGENVVWSTPSPLWNRVMRGGDIDGDPLCGDLVCMHCFVTLAFEQGIAPARWRLTADPEPEGLVYETPTGRVWDQGQWLWVNAEAEPGDGPPYDDGWNEGLKHALTVVARHLGRALGYYHYREARAVVERALSDSEQEIEDDLIIT